MIRCLLFYADRAPTPCDFAKALQDSRIDDTTTLWVDVEGDDESELAEVGNELKLDRATLELARKNGRHPAVRVLPDQLLVTAMCIDGDATNGRPRASIIELDALVGQNYILTLHRRPLPFRETLEERLGTNPQLGRFASSHVLYAVLDTLLASYARELNEIESKVHKLEEMLLRDSGDRALSQALMLKRHIQRIRRVIAPHREAFAVLVGADSPIDDQQVEEYFRDLIRRLGTILDHADHLRDVVTGGFSLYISNVSNRTNQQLRVLTFLSAVLLPISAITGIYGTNFRLHAYEARDPFFLMLAGMIAITGAMLAFFRRQGWL